MKRLLVVVGILLCPALLAPTAWGQANIAGQWTTLPYEMPINPVHLAMLPNGEVLAVSGSGSDAANSQFQAALVDTQLATVTVQSLTWDMFGNGIAVLPDGRPFIVGGTASYNPFQGTSLTATYNPSTGQFANMQSMAHGRWFPTATVLGNGSVMAFSGLDENGNPNSTAEIYTIGSGWSPAYAAPFTPPVNPWMHLLPNGKVFFAGSSPISAIFDPSTNTWTTNVASTNFGGARTYGSSVLLPLTPANGYKPVTMVMGGSNPATATTELIDLSASNPSWQYGPSMSQPRTEMSTVILPTGKVLALGGSTNDNDSSTAALNADLYDPSTNTFSSAGTATFPRLYNSTALLLPDATVLVAGSNPQPGVFQQSMEVYSPAYLFTTDSSGHVVPATRPTISSVSSGTLGYGGTFQIQTPDAATISSVVVVRSGSDVHGFDGDQRLVGLSFTAGSRAVLNVTTPPDSNIAPPGYYMLFLVNSSGVPSVATFVQFPIGGGATVPPTGTIASPLADTTVGVGQTVNFSGSGTDTDGTISTYSWVFPGGMPSLSTLQSPGPVSYLTAGSYVASLTVTDSNGVSDPNPPTRTVTVVPNFSLAASPSSQTVTPGSGAAYITTVSPGTGFAGTVTLSVDGLPTGATASFSPGSLASSNSTLSITTPSTTRIGTYPLTITGTSGVITQTATVTLVVSNTSSRIAGSSSATTPIAQVADAQISTPAVVSSLVTVGACNAPTTTCTTYDSGNVPVGDSILVVASWGGSTTTATVSDAVNTYSTIAGPFTNAAGTDRAQIWLIKSNAASVNHETVTLSGPSSGAQILVWMVPITGLNTTTPIDTNVTHTNAGNGTSMTTGTSNVASAYPSEMIWGVFLEDNYSQNYAPESGFTNLSGQEAASLLEYKNVTQTGTQTVTGTNSVGANNWAGIVFGLIAAGQTGGSPTLTSLAITPASPSTIKGGTVQLTATGTYSDGSTQNLTNSVTWTSATTSVATINSSGLATGVTTGTSTIKATSGAISASVVLTVSTSVNFMMSATPSSQTVVQGSSTTYTPTATATGGFNGVVTFSVSGLPTGATGTFSPTTVTGSGSSTLTVTTASTTPAGTYTLTITGTSGSLVNSTTATLIVNPTVNFTLTAAPASQTILQGGSTTYSTTVSTTGGFSSAIAFTVSGLPSGATGTFSPTSVTGAGSTTLTVTTVDATLVGTYTLTITGTGGGLVRTAPVTLVINSAGSQTLVSLAVTPANSSISIDATQQFSVTGTYADGSTQNLTSSATWTSSNPSVATVTSAALATSVSAGGTAIQATVGAISGSTSLTVSSTISGLVGHWTFDAGSGTTAADSSGNGYNATLYNGVTWVTGKVGDAVSANGTNQYANTPSINLSTTQAVSFAMWINRTYTNGASVLIESSTNFNNETDAFGFFPDEAADCGNGAMEIGLQGDVGYNVKCFAQPTSGAWHHLAIVLDKSQSAANEINLYIDGVLQTALQQSYSSNNTNDFGTYPLYMFSRAGTTGFAAAEMDDLQLYNRALTASDIEEIYNSASPNFTLTSTPSSQTVVQGSSTTYTPSVTGTGGFSGTVTLSVSGLPTGATGTFSPTSVTGSGTSTLTVTTASTTPTGTYTLTITGTSGSLVQSTTTTLVVSVPPNFSVTATPSSQTVVQGASTTYTPTVTPTGGFNGVVTFSVSGLPTGATGTFSPTTVTGSGSSTLTVSTVSTTPTGTYTLTITGTSGSLVNTATTTLVVNVPPNFTVTATPSSQTVTQGSSTTYSSTVAPTGGFSGVVTFSVSGLPTGATGTFSPSTVTGSGTSTLTVSTVSTTPTGTYTLTITGTSGSLVNSTTATFVVNVPPNFTVAATPSSQTVTQGSSTTYTPTVTATGGFTGVVTFSVSGLPTGATGTFSPTTVTGSGSSTLTVSTVSTTPTGTYTLTITGTSGSLVNSTTATLIVSAAPNFTLTATPSSQTVAQGSNTTYTSTATASGGFTGVVTFTVSGLPTGATGTFSPTTVTGSGSSTLTVSTLSTTATGTYTLTITGTSGSLVHTTTTTLVVSAASNFTLTATPASQSVLQGSSTTYTPTVAATGGFTGVVTFSVSGLPTGATGTFSPTTVTGSGSSTLTVKTVSTTPTGTSTLTITGTSGSLVHTATVTLVVTSTASFTLAATPASQTAEQGNTTTYTPTVTATGGFTGVVTFSVSGLPTGATGTFSPTTVTGSGSSTLTVVTGATTPTGTSTLTITGTSGSLVQTATVSLVVNSAGSATLVSVSVTPANFSIATAATAQFTATGIYSDGSTQNLTSSATWTSSTTNVATIGATGLATGVAAGSTAIQATSGGITGTTGLMDNLSGLVGHWTFDAGSGTTAVDSSGNGYTATLVNGITWVPGEIADAVSANGTNQSASTPSINLSSTAAVSFTMWLNRTYGAGPTAMLEFSSNFNNYTDAFGFFPDETTDCGTAAMEISVKGTAGFNIKCFAQPSSGVWHNLAVVLDKTQAAANEVNLYVDGVLQTALKQTYSSDNTNNFGTYPLYLFARAGTTGYAAGEMDDLQLYNRALAASDVLQIYNSSSSSFTMATTPSTQSVTPGNNATYTPTVTATGSFDGAVTFNVTGLPTGATATFSPTTVTGSGSSTLTVATSATTPAGTYTLTITGTCGTTTVINTESLVVQ